MTTHIDIRYKRRDTGEIDGDEFNFVAEDNEFEVIRKWFEDNNLKTIILENDSELEKRICMELSYRVVVKRREKNNEFPHDILLSYVSGLGKIYEIFTTVYDFSVLGWNIEMRCYW